MSATDSLKYKRLAGNEEQREVLSRRAETLFGLPVLPVTPVRQSDAYCYWQCGRKFALQKRLGLVPKGVRPTWARDVGSFYAILMCAFRQGKTKQQGIQAAVLEMSVDIEKARLQVKADGTLPGGSTFAEYCKTANQALQLASAMTDFAIPRVYQKFHEKYKVIHAELKLEYVLPEITNRIAFQGTLDALCEDSDGVLWVIDDKTTSKPPVVRVQTCGFEHQTLLYPLLVKKMYPDRKIGGMIHVAIQRPGISFGQNDRDYTDHEHVLKSGPRKGQTEMRRTYDGEPKYENYLRRVTEWYLAEGEYLELRAERECAPVVAVSQVMLDDKHLLTEESRIMLRELATAKRCVPDMNRFYRNPFACMPMGKHQKPCAYLEFCQRSEDQWSAVAHDKFDQIVPNPDEEETDE